MVGSVRRCAKVQQNRLSGTAHHPSFLQGWSIFQGLAAVKRVFHKSACASLVASTTTQYSNLTFRGQVALINGPSISQSIDIF
jgi:hypothetical protein